MSRFVAGAIVLSLLAFPRLAEAQEPFSEPTPTETPSTPPPTEIIVAHPDVAAEAPRVFVRPRPSPPVGLRIDGGYSARSLVALPVTGADVGLAFGQQPSANFAFWGASRLFLGSTENGLNVFTFRLGPDFEAVFDRFRIGGGVNLFIVGISRALRDETILSWGPAAVAATRVDIVQSDGFAIFGRAAIDVGYEVYNGSIYWGPTLGVGVDFDIHGQRATAYLP